MDFMSKTINYSVNWALGASPYSRNIHCPKAFLDETFLVPKYKNDPRGCGLIAK
jgi:hypothetical protein